MSITGLHIRPLKSEDVEQLDLWRHKYTAGWLELPHGMAGPGVETAVVEKDGKLLGSLTAIDCVVFDPFIHDPDARGTDVFPAVLMLERVLAYSAQARGGIDGYIAVPKQLTEYIAMVRRAGYTETCQECVIMRRPFVPDVVPLIENETVK